MVIQEFLKLQLYTNQRDLGAHIWQHLTNQKDPKGSKRAIARGQSPPPGPPAISISVSAAVPPPVPVTPVTPVTPVAPVAPVAPVVAVAFLTSNPKTNMEKITGRSETKILNDVDEFSEGFMEFQDLMGLKK